jgi:hypothetical protein
LNICAIRGIILPMQADIQLFLIITLNILVFVNTIVIIIGLGIIALTLNKTNIQMADIWKYLSEIEELIKASRNLIESIWWTKRTVP